MQEQFSDENHLKKALSKGQKEAFQFLMHTYHKKLCVYAFTLCKDQVQAEDIVQNVFLRLWKNRITIKIQKRVSSFLYKSVYNEFIDQFRKAKKLITLEKKHIESLSIFLENESNEDLDKLIQLINQEIENLPPKCKGTFLLSKKEGLTNFEIADYLEISVKSVEAHITRAYKILKEKIKSTYQ